MSTEDQKSEQAARNAKPYPEFVKAREQAELRAKLTEVIGAFAAELTDEQVAGLVHGSLGLVVVEAAQASRPEGCRCSCEHLGGCLTCGCTCEAPSGLTCPCCGVTDTDLSVPTQRCWGSPSAVFEAGCGRPGPHQEHTYRGWK